MAPIHKLIACICLTPAAAVPAGHARKRATHCRQCEACDVPVYCVRMDYNPGQLGRWKQRERSADRAPCALAYGDSSS